MSNPSKKALVIGAGFAGMSVATFLAKKGWSVSVIEKHNLPGGRARKFEAQGFTFDMAQVGIGCPMFSSVILQPLEKRFPIFIN